MYRRSVANTLAVLVALLLLLPSATPLTIWKSSGDDTDSYLNVTLSDVPTIGTSYGLTFCEVFGSLRTNKFNQSTISANCGAYQIVFDALLTLYRSGEPVSSSVELKSNGCDLSNSQCNVEPDAENWPINLALAGNGEATYTLSVEGSQIVNKSQPWDVAKLTGSSDDQLNMTAVDLFATLTINVNASGLDQSSSSQPLMQLSASLTYNMICENGLVGYSCNVDCENTNDGDKCYTCDLNTGDPVCCDGFAMWPPDNGQCYSTALDCPCDCGNVTPPTDYFWLLYIVIVLIVIIIVLLIIMLILCCFCGVLGGGTKTGQKTDKVSPQKDPKKQSKAVMPYAQLDTPPSTLPYRVNRVEVVYPPAELALNSLGINAELPLSDHPPPQLNTQSEVTDIPHDQQNQQQRSPSVRRVVADDDQESMELYAEIRTNPRASEDPDVQQNPGARQRPRNPPPYGEPAIIKPVTYV